MAMAENEQRGSSSFKVRLLNSFGLQSADMPVRSATLPKAATNPVSQFYLEPSEKTTVTPTKAIRKGWLRKQGGLLMRSWQARWFVLVNNSLIQYMTDDESQAPVSLLVLRNHNIREIPVDNAGDEASKFIFELTSSTGGSSTSLRVQESYVLSAETENERRDWIRAIKQVMYSDNGGAIFGQSLDATMSYEQERNPGRQVPEIVELCCEFIRSNGMNLEGLFRLPGRNKIVKQLRDAFDVGGSRPSFEDIDVHSVASLLKAYLRELPHPIVPVDHYDSVMKIITRQRPLDKEGAVQALSVAVSRLPRHNRNLLQYICSFLKEVASHSDLNKMNASNLATVFCPYFVEPEVDDPALLAGTSANRTTAVLDMISEFDKIFPPQHDSFDWMSESGESYHTCIAYNTVIPEKLSEEPPFLSVPVTVEMADFNEGRESDSGSDFQEACLTNGGRSCDRLTSAMEEMLVVRDPGMESSEHTQTALNGEAAVPSSEIANEVCTQLDILQQQLSAERRLNADLQQQLIRERSEAARQSQLLAQKLAEERDATREAVTRVIELQSRLEKYSLKYGPLS